MTTRLLILIACVGCGSGGEPNDPDGGNPPPVQDMPPDMPPPPPTCSPADPNSCSGETICIGTTCEPAFNRIYTFGQISITVAAKNQGGGDWDPLGGQPDPQVAVKLNGTQVLSTGHKDNVFTGDFTESTDQQIVGGSKLELDMSDDDGIGDDHIFGCTHDPITADDLRQAVIQCDGSGTESGSQIVIHINVKG